MTVTEKLAHAAERMAAMEMAQRLQEVVIILVGIRCMIRAVLK